jgi:DTW domain-containing protein YfiP
MKPSMSPSINNTTSRQQCDTCQRPVRTCFCRFIQQVNNDVELLILQHPEESGNAKNTAGLLHLSLKNSHLYCAEQFDAQELEQLIFADQRQPLLLYPALADYHSLGLTPPPPTPRLTDFSPTQLRLVVIDATWRKSRKMLYLNAPLQQLPLLSLQHIPPSIYTIRKAHSENQLSTLEASCYALQQLEQAGADYSPVLQAMRDFVAQLAAFVPQSPR